MASAPRRRQPASAQVALPKGRAPAIVPRAQRAATDGFGAEGIGTGLSVSGAAVRASDQ
jgi:hypothetical protein